MESESYPTTTRLLEPRRTTEHATPATQASGHRSVPASTGGRYFFPLPHASVRTQPRREERRPTNESELGRPRTQPRRFPTPHSSTTYSAGAVAVQSRAPPFSSSSPTRHTHSYKRLPTVQGASHSRATQPGAGRRQTPRQSRTRPPNLVIHRDPAERRARFLPRRGSIKSAAGGARSIQLPRRVAALLLGPDSLAEAFLGASGAPVRRARAIEQTWRRPLPLLPCPCSRSPS